MFFAVIFKQNIVDCQISLLPMKTLLCLSVWGKILAEKFKSLKLQRNLEINQQKLTLNRQNHK